MRIEYYWLPFTFICILAAGFCENAQEGTRGKGSWRTDRELQALRGAFYAFALVCSAMFIEALLFT